MVHVVPHARFEHREHFRRDPSPQAVRAEGAKVTWPTRRETLITTGLVIAMVIIASIFFVTVDSILRWLVQMLLTLTH